MKLKTSEKQAAAVRKLARLRCCNYDHGFCLRLDDVCPQEMSVSGVICKHFANAVLPDDGELWKLLLGRSKI